MIEASIGVAAGALVVAFALLTGALPFRRSIPSGRSDPSEGFPWAATVIVRGADGHGWKPVQLHRWHANEAEARRWAISTGERLRSSFPKHRIGWTVSRRTAAE